jgi:hypothetical protein
MRLKSDHAGILVDKIAEALDKLIAAADPAATNEKLCLALELSHEEV